MYIKFLFKCLAKRFKKKDRFKIDRLMNFPALLFSHYYCPLCFCHVIVTRARSEPTKVGWAQ